VTTVGVLALQGAFIEHVQRLGEQGAETVEVRLPEDLDGLDGLILPGGESTTIGKLAATFGLIEPLREFARTRPVWGTCAGMIFLARDIGTNRQPILGVMDIVVNRNAFGRQIDSFETGLDIKGVEGGPFHAVFIRAPIITSAGPAVDVLAALDDGRIVAAQQDQMLVTAFHPELTPDGRLHAYFLSIVESAKIR